MSDCLGGWQVTGARFKTALLEEICAAARGSRAVLRAYRQSDGPASPGFDTHILQAMLARKRLMAEQDKFAGPASTSMSHSPSPPDQAHWRRRGGGGGGGGGGHAPKLPSTFEDAIRWDRIDLMRDLLREDGNALSSGILQEAMQARRPATTHHQQQHQHQHPPPPLTPHCPIIARLQWSGSTWSKRKVSWA